MTDDPLRELLGPSPLPDNPATGSQLLARARERRGATARAGAALGILIVLAAFGSSILLRTPPPADLTARGADLGPQVALEWLVEDQSLHRTARGAVNSNQTVIFNATASTDGYLCLDELDDQLRWQRVFPDEGTAWRVSAGTHVPMSAGAIQAFRTDQGPGLHTYRVSLDLNDAACGSPLAHADRQIEWLP